jgi:hypothetical protein
MPFAAAPRTPPPFEVATRGRLLLGWAYDLATLALSVLASSVLATAWMLARTGRGRDDLEITDAILGLALALAAAPAWTAWQWLSLHEAGRTFGQARAHLVPPAPLQGVGRVVSLLLHPASLPLWAWTFAALYLSGAPPLVVLSSLPLVWALVVTLTAAVSLVMLLARPTALPLHRSLASALVRERR